MNPLLELKKLGQSVWFDNLRRGLVISGELKRMMDEYGITGVTSNPTIFEKAIAGTDEYDEEIQKLVKEDLEEADIVKELVIDDIKGAADVLAPVFKETGGKDGFVSVEARPTLARDTKAAIVDARGLFSRINRPNVMVKVPATAEGLPAIEELTFEGYNINVTLLFSVDRYEEAAWSYIRGLERRAAEGKPLDNIFSVASFFVSRVNVLADKMIEERIEKETSNDRKARLRDLIGKVSIANAKLAYIRYNEIFNSPRFLALEEKGAKPQKLLWASTSTKNPKYNELMYVDGLIEKGTISTIPLHTMLSFYSHGKVSPTLAEGLLEAARTIAELSLLGIDYAKLTAQLEDEGVRKFTDSYLSLLKSVAEKKKKILGEKVRAVEFALDGFIESVNKAVGEMESRGFIHKLWAKDPALWKKTPGDRKLITDSLGWLTLPELMEVHKDAINSFAVDVRNSGFTDVVLLGMGGSSLAPLVLNTAFGRQKGYPELTVLDSTDTDAIKAVNDHIDPLKTLFIVSSKSGSTIEPLSFFEYFYDRVYSSAGEDAGRNFIAITDPGTPLEGFARKYRFRRIFLNPHDIGGRYSALSFFGLVPAALAGIDISRLLYYAGCVSAATQPCVHPAENPAVSLGVALGTLAASGIDKVTFLLSKEVSSFGLWVEQLLAESTGKDGVGLIPVTNEPIGSPEAYGDDRVFVYIGIGEPDKKTFSLIKALEADGHPVISFRLENIHEIGGEFLRWEVATAAAGSAMGINPFDQPDVELSKKNTAARLGKIGKKGGGLKLPGVALEGPEFKISFGKAAFKKLRKTGFKAEHGVKKAMKNFMGFITEGDYIGVLAYYNPMDDKVEKILAELRALLRDSTGAATQFGWGPRYLHSTGQLHKGGPDKGVFLILTHGSKEEARIPGSSFSFPELELSQAFGDMEALDSKGRRVALLHLKDSTAETLQEAVDFIKGAILQATAAVK